MFEITIENDDFPSLDEKIRTENEHKAASIYKDSVALMTPGDHVILSRDGEFIAGANCTKL